MKEKTFLRANVLLPGLTVLFLCALLVLHLYDGSLAAVRTDREAAAQEIVLPDPAPVNVNTAAAEELETLPGIGPALARRIVEYREVNGPFERKEELTAVSGISWETLAGLEDYITTDGGNDQ